MKSKSIKKLGLASIILIIINQVIGTGIFLTPGSTVASVGTYAPLVYIAAGLFAMLIGLSFARAASYISTNGAAYAYVNAAFGEKLGVYMGVTKWVTGTIAWGSLTVFVVRTFISIVLPNVEATTSVLTIGFIIMTIIVVLVNNFGVALFKVFNHIATIGKVGALLLFTLFGAYMLTKGQNNFASANDVIAISNTTVSFKMFVSAVITAIYAYTGFEAAAAAAEDYEQPEKKILIALPVALLGIIVLYTSVVAMGMVIDASTLATTTETVALASVISNPFFKNVVLVGALMSMFGIVLVGGYVTPKYLTSIANDNHIPKVFAKTNRYGTPMIAILVSVLLAFLFPLALKYNTISLVGLAVIARFIQYLIVPICVIVFYLGKNKFPVNEVANKSLLSDVIIPIGGVLVSIVLVYNYTWGKLIYSDYGTDLQSLNWFSVGLLIFGFILLPLIVYFGYSRLHGKKA